MELYSILLIILPIIITIAIIEGILKAICLWKSARRNQLGWFICILIFNTLGILPIIYLIKYRDKSKVKKKK